MTTDQLERRAAELEVRAKGRKLEGYAAVFDTQVLIADFHERIAQGAFSESLRIGDKLALVDHDAAKVLARTRNGSLKLAEDTRGLHFTIELPNTTLARFRPLYRCTNRLGSWRLWCHPQNQQRGQQLEQPG